MRLLRRLEIRKKLSRIKKYIGNTERYYGRHLKMVGRARSLKR